MAAMAIAMACTEAFFSGDFNLLRFRKGLRLCDNAALVEVQPLASWHHDRRKLVVCACLWAQGFQSWCKTRLLRPKFLMQINQCWIWICWLQVPIAPWYSEVVDVAKASWKVLGLVSFFRSSFRDRSPLWTEIRWHQSFLGRIFLMHISWDKCGEIRHVQVIIFSWTA